MVPGPYICSSSSVSLLLVPSSHCLASGLFLLLPVAHHFLLQGLCWHFPSSELARVKCKNRKSKWGVRKACVTLSYPQSLQTLPTKSAGNHIGVSKLAKQKNENSLELIISHPSIFTPILNTYRELFSSLLFPSFKLGYHL